ncbi:ATP-binding cassette transporter [Ganoderma sinense ZZ0214-1]|uniref:ATP-binding cassette transporter n=1 Tax=Ganoderma sinense ZZ0214-1 TaxID=1077348 RepID=A0A2G8SSU4_9APHY|nr:ATP-binding cassette transporter [Ganoderma sinense ZZ0214-1]
MQLCSGAHWTDLSDPCIRSFLATSVPTAFVGAVLVAALPPVQARLRNIGQPLLDFLSLPEAEALLVSEGYDSPKDQHHINSVSRILLVAISLVEFLVWLGLGCYRLISDFDNAYSGIQCAVLSNTWLYATLRPIIWPTVTVPFDLFFLFILHLGFSVINGAGFLFDCYLYNTPFPPLLEIFIYAADLLAISGLLTIVFNVSLAVPDEHTKKDIGPEDYTTLWGWMTFDWVAPLIHKARDNHGLNADDIWLPSPIMRARPLYFKFSRLPGRLLVRLWKANSRDMLVDFLLMYVSVVLGYASPFFLKRILDALDVTQGDQRAEARALAFVYAFAVYACSILRAQTDLQHLFFGRRAGSRVRSELMVAVYDKALKRKEFSGVVGKGEDDTQPSSADNGKILNLMSSDVTLVSNTVSAMHIVYGAPFEIVIATLFLYKLLGWAAFAGFIVIIITLPLNDIMAKRTNRIAKGTSAARDKRMDVLNELITAVKFIKFFAWEDRWVKRVLDSRTVELQWMVKERLNTIGFSLLGTISPVLVSVVSFYVYIAQGNQLTIGTAFTAIALYGMVRLPFNTANTFLFQLLRSMVALDRIAAYLEEEEVDEQVSTLKGQCATPNDRETGLGIVDGSFQWNASSLRIDRTTPNSVATTDDASSSTPTQHGHFKLEHINVRFPESKLTVIAGPTASGKTALLMALLGELTTLHGCILIPKDPSNVDDHGLSHTISYAAQMPWLRHQSIKDNILFDFPCDEERYHAVVEACALNPDLAILEDGDATEIGIRGVSLSGGQKARVALARAVYAPTKYVLLDDPLSAVDSHTAQFLIENLFRGPLLANRTVILVTHHLDLVLPAAHYLVRMLDGCIDTQDTVENLRTRGILGKIAALEEGQARTQMGERNVVRADDSLVSGEAGGHGATNKKPRVLVEAERRATGRVKWPIYNIYLRASSYWTWYILLLLIIASQLMGTAEKFWIKVWGEAYGKEDLAPFLNASASQYWNGQKTQHVLIMAEPTSSGPTNVSTLPSAQAQPYFYLAIYATIALSSGLISICAAAVQYTGALRASKSLFELLLKNVVHATMRWYDVTPQGRIINRFSKDINTIDSSLSQTLQEIIQYATALAVAMFTIVAIFPSFFIPAAVVVSLYVRTAIMSQPAGRDIRRLESTSTSPIFAALGETLDGIITIRAFGMEARFLDGFFEKVDAAAQLYHMFWQVNRWLLLNLQMTSAIAILATTLFALSGYLDAGLAGICITSALSFTNSVYWVCRNWASLELDFNSIERVVEYLEVPQEPPTIVDCNRPPAYWPSSTSTNKDSFLVIEDLSVKYAPDLPSVLHGISFSLKARERVGLLGRTGSGKSTLAMSILRFVEPASGTLVIDGINIGHIGLHDLRSRITFIPQDATLFSGTLRENLDPFSPSGTTSERATVIETRGLRADLDTIVLGMQVSVGGTNFSQGQRQLVSMARALLRRSTIVVFDEATSSIDFETDAKIQATIREEFGGSLLLTVAHRIRTVIDYDRLLVLDKGKLVEFDTPLNLIRKEGGVFREMCLKSGMMEELGEAAAASLRVESDVREYPARG